MMRLRFVLWAGLLSLGLLMALPKDSIGAKETSVKTLDAINIEGRIRFPRVLFISSREQPKTMDYLHRHYLGSTLELLERCELPDEIRISQPSQSDAEPVQKEKQP